jgi:hypothetical protein
MELYLVWRASMGGGLRYRHLHLPRSLLGAGHRSPRRSLSKGKRKGGAQRESRVWCCGASLSGLLPVIEINKEFTEFFNDPKRERGAASGLPFFLTAGWLRGGSKWGDGIIAPDSSKAINKFISGGKIPPDIRRLFLDRLYLMHAMGAVQLASSGAQKLSVG